MSIISRHQSKAQSYARYLDSVRAAGLWSHPIPLSTKGALADPNTSSFTEGLPWAELIRKYLKHNPDRALTAEIVTTELALRLLTVNAHKETNYDYDQIHLKDDLETGKSPLPTSLRTQDKESAQKLVTYLSQTLDRHILNEADPKSSNERNAAYIIISFGYYLLDDHSKSLEFIGKSSLEIPQSLSPQLEKYDVILILMGLTIKALVAERQGASSTTSIESYNRVIEAYDRCLSCLSPVEESNHELHHWAELAIYRNCVLSRVTISPMDSLEAHRKYYCRCKYWPVSFRLHKRGMIFKSYIKLLFVTFKSNSWKASESPLQNEHSEAWISSSQEEDQATIRKSDITVWRKELILIEKLYSNLLKRTTTFPKAGSINHSILELCDLIFEGWKLGGSDSESASHLIEILHDSTRKTFHSQKILRYLIQLLDVKSDLDEAEAALDLYFQLHTSSTNPSNINSNNDNNLTPGEDHFTATATSEENEKKDDNCDNIGLLDRETDEEFIDTMIYGSRMLIKSLNNPDKASKLLERAHSVLKASKDQNLQDNKNLISRLVRMRGIAAGGCAQKADQETRPALHASYLEFLKEAALLNPTSFENMYHLAFAQAELRDIDSALISARTAVEINPNHLNAWHLLCLLTSASKEFKLALDIAEVGLVNTDDLDDNDDRDGIRTPKDASSSRLSRDSSSVRDTVLTVEEVQVEQTTTDETTKIQIKRRSTQLIVPVPATSTSSSSPNQIHQDHSSFPSNVSPASIPTHYHLEFPVDKTENLQASIQLRITKNALIESLMGPEVALSDQQNLFAFFAQVCSQIHNQDLLSTVHSHQSIKSSAITSTVSNNHLNSTPAATSSLPTSSHSTTRSSVLRSSKLIKSRKANFDLKISNSIGRRSQISQSSHALKQRSISGASTNENVSINITQEMIDRAQQQEEEKKTTVNQRSNKILQDLWLMSAATFRRWGRSKECKGAIEEAEKINEHNSDLWTQYGLYCLTKNQLDLAIESFNKSISICNLVNLEEAESVQIASIVHLSRILKEQGCIELAEGFLDMITQTFAWDSTEAWFLISQIYFDTGRLSRAKECLIFSLALEESKPIRPLRRCLPACL